MEFLQNVYFNIFSNFTTRLDKKFRRRFYINFKFFKNFIKLKIIKENRNYKILKKILKIIKNIFSNFTTRLNKKFRWQFQTK